MANFILLYKGNPTSSEDMTPEAVNEVMGKWATWMQGVGDSMVDMGTPMGAGISMVDDGSTGEVVNLNGYSIISAESLEQAQELSKGHPFLSDNDGLFSVELLELLPVPGM